MSDIPHSYKQSTTRRVTSEPAHAENKSDLNNPFKTTDLNKLCNPAFPSLQLLNQRAARLPGSSHNGSSNTVNTIPDPRPSLKYDVKVGLSSRPSNDFSLISRSDKQLETISSDFNSSKLGALAGSKRGEETGFKSALDVMPYQDGFPFEEKMAILTDAQVPRDSKEWVLEDTVGSSDMVQNRANSMDEVLSYIFEEGEADGRQADKDSVTNFKLSGIEEIVKGNKKKKRIITLVILLLILLLVGSGSLVGIAVFSCHDSNGICVPQLKVQLTDKSHAAKSALLTVKEALKVVSYLALDFGDTHSDLDLINSSLDSYYQAKVIDTFNVDTIYTINVLGYCRQSITKGNRRFCMKSYGFDLLSVFARDAGVQLGELTKTNINLMGDSFVIAYELAINAFDKLNTADGDSQEYINWAILLQKFSKGLGFLTYSELYIDCILLVELITLMIIINVNVTKVATKNSIHLIKKILVITMTALAFSQLLSGFLICSLTLEYYLKLTELAQSIGIANIETGTGFYLIWISFILHIVSVCMVLFLANSFRKGVF